MQQSAQPPTIESTSGHIVSAAYREDGWEIEVENVSGVRLTYWVGGTHPMPVVGSTIHFYRGGVDKRVCRIEIDGRRVFDGCPA